MENQNAQRKYMNLFRLYSVPLCNLLNCVLTQLLLYFNSEPLHFDAYLTLLLCFCAAFACSMFYFCLYDIYFSSPNNQRQFPCWLVVIFNSVTWAMQTLGFVYSIRITLLFDLWINGGRAAVICGFLMIVSGLAMSCVFTFCCYAPIPIICGGTRVAVVGPESRPSLSSISSISLSPQPSHSSLAAPTISVNSF